MQTGLYFRTGDVECENKYNQTCLWGRITGRSVISGPPSFTFFAACGYHLRSCESCQFERSLPLLSTHSIHVLLIVSNFGFIICLSTSISVNWIMAVERSGIAKDVTEVSSHTFEGHFYKILYEFCLHIFFSLLQYSLFSFVYFV